jgi:hypothetical protein
MECEFCGNKFSNKQNLNQHQKKTKYCLKLQGKTVDTEYKCDGCLKTFTIKGNLIKHQKICRNDVRNERLLEENEEYKKQIIILEQRISNLETQVRELKLDKKNLQERYDKLSLTAVKRPVNSTKNIQINNFIQKMEPLRIEDIEESVPMLTLDHHVKGPEGYAEYALEFPFKDKIVCVDVNRNKIKYKDGQGNVIEDVGFRKMMTKLCNSVKDRSFNLCQEHYEKLSDQFTEKELDEYNCMNTALAISRYANGRESDFCNKMIKLISKGSKVAAK